MDTNIETSPDDILLRLTNSQRALMAAEMVTTKLGTNQYSDVKIINRKMAAEAYGISPRSVVTALHVLKHGNDDLIHSVREGDLSLSAAFKTCHNPRHIKESDWQQQVLDTAHENGWIAFHTQASIRSTGPGFPDLILIRERILYVELKAEIGQLAEHQEEWKIAIQNADGEYHLWRPSDWDSVQQILQKDPATSKPNIPDTPTGESHE